ncbi:MAG: hypothetical protein QXN36_08545 [Candidatus Bathyarchaeia archaeon]
MNIHHRKTSVKRIFTEKDSEIHELAKELNIFLDSEAIKNITTLGLERINSEAQLKETIKELEEKKKKLEREFKEIASKRIMLEAQYVGLRSQIVRTYRDNQAFAMHLCAKTLRNEHESQLREKLIQKYIIDSKRI